MTADGAITALLDDLPRTSLVVGKGGVGKTTTATDIARACAERGEHTLLLSTDPAAALASVLGEPVADDAGPVGTTGHLFARQLDAQRLRDNFLHAWRDVIAEIVDLFKIYQKTAAVEPVFALRSVSLQIRRGEMLAIMGSSGSGKSTLMNILGCLDRPTGGQYLLDGKDIGEMNDAALSEFRGRTIGFIFQAFNLIPAETIEENVAVPLFYQSVHKHERRQRAIESLTLVGLGDRLGHRPRELSGGQQQRVAIARALVTRPVVLLADEPTGNLDSATGCAILDTFDSLHRKGMTIIMVTHDAATAARCHRVVRLRDGVVEFDRTQEPSVLAETSAAMQPA